MSGHVPVFTVRYRNGTWVLQIGCPAALVGEKRSAQLTVTAHRQGLAVRSGFGPLRPMLNWETCAAVSDAVTLQRVPLLRCPDPVLRAAQAQLRDAGNFSDLAAHCEELCPALSGEEQSLRWAAWTFTAPTPSAAALGSLRIHPASGRLTPELLTPAPRAPVVDPQVTQAIRAAQRSGLNAADLNVVTAWRHLSTQVLCLRSLRRAQRATQQAAEHCLRSGPLGGPAFLALLSRAAMNERPPRAAL